MNYFDRTQNVHVCNCGSLVNQGHLKTCPNWEAEQPQPLCRLCPAKAVGESQRLCEQHAADFQRSWFVTVEAFLAHHKERP